MFKYQLRNKNTFLSATVQTLKNKANDEGTNFKVDI